jgi:hypothetical protein
MSFTEVGPTAAETINTQSREIQGPKRYQNKYEGDVLH